MRNVIGSSDVSSSSKGMAAIKQEQTSAFRQNSLLLQDSVGPPQTQDQNQMKSESELSMDSVIRRKLGASYPKNYR